MSLDENTHNKDRAKRHRGGIIAVVLLCVVMALVLTGVLLNNQKNDIRLEGILFYTQGDYDKAIVKLEEARQTWAPFSDFLDMDMYWYEGSCYLMLGDYVRAKDIYEAMLAKSKNPERIMIYQQIAAGLTAYMGDRYEEAAETLAVCAGENCPSLYLYLGSCYMELSRYEEMMQAFDAYKELGLDSDFLHAEMAGYYMSLGDYQTAQAEVAAGLALLGSHERELRWQEVCCLEYLRDYNGAYEKMYAFAQDYTLDDTEQREWDFLQTVYVEAETNAEAAGKSVIIERSGE